MKLAVLIAVLAVFFGIPLIQGVPLPSNLDPTAPAGLAAFLADVIGFWATLVSKIVAGLINVFNSTRTTLL